MSEELAYSFPVISSNDAVISDTYNTPANDEASISYGESLQVGQQVQFLKVTLQKSGKISYKETFGKITCVSDGFVEIEDYLGDVVRSSMSNVKKSDSSIFMCKEVEFLNVV